MNIDMLSHFSSLKAKIIYLCKGSFIVVLNIYMCLTNYGASEAVNLCKVQGEIHQMFGTKMRQFLENKISRSLTAVCASYFPAATHIHFY